MAEDNTPNDDFGNKDQNQNFNGGPAFNPFNDLTPDSFMDIYGRTTSPDQNEATPTEIPMDVWVPDRAIQAINMEKQLHPTKTDAELANDVLKSNLPVVAVGIAHTAKYANDARLRLQAQTYIMDRVLGKVGTSNITDADPMDTLLKSLMENVSQVVGEQQKQRQK